MAASRYGQRAAGGTQKTGCAAPPQVACVNNSLNMQAPYSNIAIALSWETCAGADSIEVEDATPTEEPGESAPRFSLTESPPNPTGLRGSEVTAPPSASRNHDALSFNGPRIKAELVPHVKRYGLGTLGHIPQILAAALGRMGATIPQPAPHEATRINSSRAAPPLPPGNLNVPRPRNATDSLQRSIQPKGFSAPDSSCVNALPG